MASLRPIFCLLLAGSLLPHTTALAQEPQLPAENPTIHMESNLVFLDVTVLDRAGNPVVKGLTKNDFTITEEKKPQRIFSFEAPDAHTGPATDNPDGKAAVTIFVIDALNTEFSDLAQLRGELRKFIAAQPAELPAPAEVMVVGNVTLDLLQGFTRSRDELLFAVDHLPAVVPFKKNTLDFSNERSRQSLDALQQIALQNMGIPGRKNIVWMGRGGPGISINGLTGKAYDKAQLYFHGVTNLLVDARVSLFVVYPSTALVETLDSNTKGDGADQGNGLPRSGDIDFASYARETGGQIFYNRNDIAAEIGESEQLGSKFYTLTYQPIEKIDNGKFRSIRVTLRNPNLRAVTKVGYYAPGKDPVQDARSVALASLSEATRSKLTFSGLDVILFRVVRFPDARAARFTLQIPVKQLDWQTAEDGTRKAHLILSAVSRTGKDGVVASRLQSMALSADAGEADHLGTAIAHVSITLPFPPKAQHVRVVVATEAGGRIAGRLGAVDISRPVIDGAPAATQPPSELQVRPQPTLKSIPGS